MKNTFKLICLLASITSCKYTDGPFISLLSVESRIAGYYIVEYVTENGIDQIDQIDSLHINSFVFLTEESQQQSAHAFGVKISDSIIYNSSWTLLNEDKDIVIGSFGCSGFYPPYEPVAFEPLPGFMNIDSTCGVPPPIWTIEKLTQNKIWLKTTFNNNNYEIHFKQAEKAE